MSERVEGDSSNRGPEQRASDQDVIRHLFPEAPKPKPEQAEVVITPETFINDWGRHRFFEDITGNVMKVTKSLDAHSRQALLYAYEERLHQVEAGLGPSSIGGVPSRKEIEEVREPLKQAVIEAERPEKHLDTGEY